MKDFDALKNIWHGQAALPKLSYDDILKEVRKSKSAFANKLLIETLGMAAAIVMFTLIWVYKPFLMWTSHLSLAIFILCCLYYIFVQFRDYRDISSGKSLFHKPDEYIVYLKNYRRNRLILNTRKYTIYSLFIGIAFALYFIEVYFVAPLWQTIAGIAFTIGWFAVCAYLMRIYITKEQNKLGDIISKLEKLEQQFAD